MVEVSIVTPTYNRANLLPLIWNSLKSQSPLFEWIVIDDGSIDNTERVIKNFNDPRITYLRLPENRGLAGARNAGVTLVKAPYVVFVDDDDEFYPGVLEDMVCMMNRADSSIGAIAYAVLSGSATEKISVMTDGAVLDEEDIVCRQPFAAAMIFIYRREVFKYRFDEDLEGSADGLWLRRISKEFKFLMVDRPGLFYHRHSDSMQGPSNQVRRSRTIAVMHERILLNHEEVLKRYPKVILLHLRAALYRYGVASDRKKVWRTYCRILRHSIAPLNLIGSTALLLLGLSGVAPVFELWRRRFNSYRYGF